MHRYRGAVDETGQRVSIDVPRRRKRRKGWRDRVALTDMGLLAKLELTGLEMRVLIAVMANVPEKGGADAFCTQAEVAKTLGVMQPSVTRAMRELQARRVVWPIGRGRWHVNTWLMFNGDFESWGAEAERDPEPVWVRGVDAGTGEMK